MKNILSLFFPESKVEKLKQTKEKSADVITEALDLFTSAQASLEIGIELGESEASELQTKIDTIQTQMANTLTNIEKARSVKNNIAKLLS